MAKNSTWLPSICGFFLAFAFSASATSAFGKEPESADERKALEIEADAGRLMDDGNYADACPKLEKARNLAPKAVGILILLGECYERNHQFLSACITYSEAHALARAQKDPRAQGNFNSCENIEPRIPRVKVVLPQSLANSKSLTLGTNDGHFAIRRDTKDPLQIEVMVDHGSHALKFSYDGRPAWYHKFSVENGEVLSVAVPNLPIFGQTPGRTERGIYLVFAPSSLALIGGAFLAIDGFTSLDKESGPVVAGAGLGLLTVGTLAIIGLVLIDPKISNGRRMFPETQSAKAQSPPPQLQFGIAPNGASLKLTF